MAKPRKSAEAHSRHARGEGGRAAVIRQFHMTEEDDALLMSLREARGDKFLVQTLRWLIREHVPQAIEEVERGQLAESSADDPDQESS